MLSIVEALNILVQGMLGNEVKSSGVKSADTLIKSSPGCVFWISVSDTAALTVKLRDSKDITGTEQWEIDIPADGYGNWIFPPPLPFETGIYLDVSTATCKVTVGYL